MAMVKPPQTSQAKKYSQLNEELLEKFHIEHPNASETQLKLMVYDELNKILTLIKPMLLFASSTPTSTAKLSTSLNDNEDDCYGLEDYPFDEIALRNMDT